MRGARAEPGRRARDVGLRPGGSVLGRVGVIPDVGIPPGLQLERQIAVMVREGRLAPGRRLPSTRRLAPRAGAHRNTVAAAYRRLAARGLVEVRHGARTRVVPTSRSLPTPPFRADGRYAGRGGGGRARPGGVVGFLRLPGLAAAAEEPATARLMAAELTVCLDADVSAETSAAPLVVALPGAAIRPPGAGTPDPIRARQDRRPELERLLRSAPTLSVVALVTSCPALLEAVQCDVARLRGDGMTLLPVDPRDGDGIRAAARGADLLIADRIAREALLELGPAVGARSVHGVRLLDRSTIDAVRRRLGAPADDSPSRTEEATP